MWYCRLLTLFSDTVIIRPLPIPMRKGMHQFFIPLTLTLELMAKSRLSSETSAGGLTSKQISLPRAISSVVTHLGLFFICLSLKFYLIVRHLCLSTEDCRMTIHHFSELSTDSYCGWSCHISSLETGATLAPPSPTPLPPNPRHPHPHFRSGWQAEGHSMAVCVRAQTAQVVPQMSSPTEALCANLPTHHTCHLPLEPRQHRGACVCVCVRAPSVHAWL